MGYATHFVPMVPVEREARTTCGRDLLTVPTESDEYGPHNPIVALAAVTDSGDYAVRARGRLAVKSCLSVIGGPCRPTGAKL
jgi:hypothetical protein